MVELKRVKCNQMVKDTDQNVKFLLPLFSLTFARLTGKLFSIQHSFFAGSRGHLVPFI